MEELIIHPRVQKDGYGNVPRLELYELAEKQSVNPLCYNGDLYTREQIRNFAERFPGTERLMFGRGFLRDPGLLYNEGKDQKIFLKSSGHFMIWYMKDIRREIWETGMCCSR